MSNIIHVDFVNRVAISKEEVLQLRNTALRMAEMELDVKKLIGNDWVVSDADIKKAARLLFQDCEN